MKNEQLDLDNTYFIADTHFRHKNVLEFENRPFITIEEMEEKMIEAWNSVVNKTSTVFIIGDFCFGNHNAWVEILDQLKGNIVLIKGNHDKTKVIDRVQARGYLRKVYEVGKYFKHGNYQFHLTHYPLEIGERPFMFNISGHIHSVPSKLSNQLNVGVDSKLMNDYYLITDAPFGTPVPFNYLLGYAEVVNDEMQQKYSRGQ